MRDPNRIFPFCNIFASFWQTYYPDLRFWQVINVIALYFEDKHLRYDPFYAEEKDWRKAIELAIEDMKREG